jgi:DNA-directed RNA polymerase specialized sigma24 family protein
MRGFKTIILQRPIVPLNELIDYLPALEPVAANISETFSFEIFKHIMPGIERVCIVLISQDYSHSEIAWILGMKPDEVSRVIYKVRNRLKKLNIDKDFITKPK